MRQILKPTELIITKESSLFEKLEVSLQRREHTCENKLYRKRLPKLRNTQGEDYVLDQSGLFLLLF